MKQCSVVEYVELNGVYIAVLTVTNLTLLPAIRVEVQFNIP